MEQVPAVLALESGRVFHGEAIGAQGHALGEVVFNTATTGYQEILTDPSYCRQLITLTTPHIGNVGTNTEDEEAEQIHASGLIVRDLPAHASNWRSGQALGEYLRAHNVVAISGIDTRALTRHLRNDGAQRGCVMAGPDAQADEALSLARTFPGLLGVDLAKVVSTDQRYDWGAGAWSIGDGFGPAAVNPEFRVVAYDFGVKRNILRLLVDRGCEVTVVPAQTNADEVLALNPDGVFLSNGPGDPEPCDYAVAATRRFIDEGVPVFGICLGHQILGLACGASTVKMKFGHHGANHPVQALDTGSVLITSQNHGFAVDEATLPASVRATHRSLFDGSLQGIELVDRPAFGFQGHPEASPGPHDARELFDRFVQMMRGHRADTVASTSNES
ncbi:MAG: glutamine-hydrolyzing carbamoyl-phosphate synthase small subunit [Gammaproteobacteria bacterium]|nr:glutamine-hydrolyzing carbamoyl-phosphate synthase small subunit [Gammaproteobacteria bacterium]